jgi:hypothetical protein
MPLQRIPHPPDSTDISPLDFYLFGKIKRALIRREIPNEFDLLKRSVRAWMTFQMPNWNASFEVGLNVLKGRLMQMKIIWPTRYTHFLVPFSIDFYMASLIIYGTPYIMQIHLVPTGPAHSRLIAVTIVWLRKVFVIATSLTRRWLKRLSVRQWVKAGLELFRIRKVFQHNRIISRQSSHFEILTIFEITQWPRNTRAILKIESYFESRVISKCILLRNSSHSKSFSCRWEIQGSWESAKAILKSKPVNKMNEVLS